MAIRTENVILTDDIRLALGNRQWKTASELVEYFRDKVPPEKAAQYFYSTKTVEGEFIPEDYAVVEGIRFMLAKTTSAVVRDGAIVYEGGRQFLSRRFRWTAWYCNLCGSRVITNPDIPKSGLCANCQNQIGKESNNES